jgi:hypothetical protein
MAPQPLLDCDECPAPIADDDLDAFVFDANHLLERVLCPRCRERLALTVPVPSNRSAA